MVVESSTLAMQVRRIFKDTAATNGMAVKDEAFENIEGAEKYLDEHKA